MSQSPNQGKPTAVAESVSPKVIGLSFFTLSKHLAKEVHDKERRKA